MKIGELCREIREKHGVTQLEVSLDTGYAPTNISAFEHDRNNNARLLLYYLTLCNDEEIRKFLRCCDDCKRYT